MTPLALKLVLRHPAEDVLQRGPLGLCDAAFELPLRCIQPLPDEVMSILLALRTEGLLVSTSSCKAVLNHPCWQSQLRLCCVTKSAVDTVPKVTDEAGSTLAQLAKVLLPLLTHVRVVDNTCTTEFM